jgi:hypothetical protein
MPEEPDIMTEPTRNPKKDPILDDLENTNPMSHEEAIGLNAVEMYVLKDLSREQERRFEAHYFDCGECARAVAVEQNLASMAPPKRETWWRRLAFPVPIPVAAALVAVIGFQNLRSIPVLRAQVAQQSGFKANTPITARPVQLGALDGEPVETPSVTVEMILPIAAESPFYRVELLGQGKLPVSQVIPAPIKGSRLSLQVTRQTLGRGSYRILVYGRSMIDSEDGPELGQYQFNIQ